jgi:hypothetical protein
MVEQAAIPTISSVFSRASVSIRFPGTKFVLQSVVGTSTYKDLDGKVIEKDELKFKDEEGFTEVFLPEKYREFLEIGDQFSLGDKNGLVGFRIPVSNYHSLVALKVKGFYKTPPGSKSNIIIAPGEIVYYHGSDYDVDTLFVMRKSKLEEGADFNEMYKKYVNKRHTGSKALVFKPGDVAGFTGKDGAAVRMEGRSVERVLQTLLNKQVEEIQRLTKVIGDSSSTGQTKTEARRTILNIESEMQRVYKVLTAAAKNKIVDLFSSNLKDPKNRRDLQTPITTDRVSENKHSVREELEKLLSPKTSAIQQADTAEFLRLMSEAGLIKSIC